MRGLCVAAGFLAAVAGTVAAPGAALGAGCSGSPSGSTSLTLTIGGRARTVLVHVPPGCAGTRPVPLVLDLHGSGSTARQEEALTGMDATADVRGFLVAYPQALLPAGSGFDWNVAFHGTADPVDPYGGQGQAYWTSSVPVAARDWGGGERCARVPVVTRPDPGVTLTSYTRCRDGSAVELYTIAGEGHEWPGGPPLPRRFALLLGPQSDAIDADRTIWAFFAAHRLR